MVSIIIKANSKSDVFLVFPIFQANFIKVVQVEVLFIETLVLLEKLTVLLDIFI